MVLRMDGLYWNTCIVTHDPFTSTETWNKNKFICLAMVGMCNPLLGSMSLQISAGSKTLVSAFRHCKQAVILMGYFQAHAQQQQLSHS